MMYLDNASTTKTDDGFAVLYKQIAERIVQCNEY